MRNLRKLGLQTTVVGISRHSVPQNDMVKDSLLIFDNVYFTHYALRSIGQISAREINYAQTVIYISTFSGV